MARLGTIFQPVTGTGDHEMGGLIEAQQQVLEIFGLKDTHGVCSLTVEMRVNHPIMLTVEIEVYEANAPELMVKMKKFKIEGVEDPQEPCSACSDGDGGCIYPHYGRAPHGQKDPELYEALHGTKLPPNFTPDPDGDSCGTYDYCLSCGGHS